MESQQGSSTRENLLQCHASIGELLDKMELIMKEQHNAQLYNKNLKELLSKARTFQRYLHLVADVAARKHHRKQLCLRYKELKRELVHSLKADQICWKYAMPLAETFRDISKKEFTPVINLYTYYGEIEFGECFSSRLGLLVTSLLTRSASSTS